MIRRSIRPNDTHATGTTYYMVGRGDNLTYIANRYHTTVASIVRLNQIRNPNLIFPRTDTSYIKPKVILLSIIKVLSFLLTEQYKCE